MNKKVMVVTVLITTMFSYGCGQPRLTQAQLNAIETREVDAGIKETFNAAAGALFDAGYTISMSDRQAGLITGSKAKDRSSQRFWIDSSIRDTTYVISISIRETDGNHCTVRVKTSVNGEPKVDKKAIDKIWQLMQRQVLMKEPLNIEKSDKKL